MLMSNMKNITKKTTATFVTSLLCTLIFTLIMAVATAAESTYSAKDFQTFSSYSDVGYDQKLRPQFHFTSRKNWLNDTNGMVYYNGEWHMYFQHNPVRNNTGMKAWGSAVSTDLIQWEQLPHAILPYPNVMGHEGKLHAIWSGSAVVDVNNALGKQKGNTKTLFALYTATNPSGFFQGGAYSTDRGRTWTKIDGGKPLIPHQEGFSRGQRDPRIFYFTPGGYYVTIMMIGGPERKVRLWKSTDLINWEPFLDLPGKAAECIDMYEVTVDGDPENKKWVISNAGTLYEVGEFDGKTWKGYGGDQKGHLFQFDHGDAYYAAQVFNQAPNGRVVQIGWLRSKKRGYRPFLKAGMPFTQQMSIPAEITLKTTPDGIRMFRNPVEEIETLYVKTNRVEDKSLADINRQLAKLKPELMDLTVRCKPKADFTLNVRGLPIQYDHAKQVFRFSNKDRVKGIRKGMESLPAKKWKPFKDDGVREVPALSVDGKVALRILVDRASLEFFVNDGRAAASFVVVPEPDNRSIQFVGNGAQRITSVVVNELASIWKGQNGTTP
jgi:sucrose-6-phosphate hydrolase SacC (GH32 family)